MPEKTPLYDLHCRLGGKIVDFAGFLLPVQYQNGIIHEHNVVRNGVGLFDVSHMGEFYLCGENAVDALQRLVTNAVGTMAHGQCRYTLMCYPDGGIVDDLLIYRLDDTRFWLVVNAANIDKDFQWMSQNLLDGATMENRSAAIGQIAVQGPKARDLMKKLVPENLIPQKSYWFTPEVTVDGVCCLLSSTGYTGESGYEVYMPADKAEQIYLALLAAGEEFGVEPIGLGARDTLRFESSMPLYGHELTADYNAAEVGLDFFVKLDKPFIGRDAVAACPKNFTRRGLKLVGKGVVREHFDVYDAKGEKIGVTTSGGVCPTLGGSFAMARVLSGLPEENVFVDVRGRRIEAEFTALPFYHKAK